MRHSEGRLASKCVRRCLAILTKRVPQVHAPERLRRPFHLGGGLDLLGHSAIRGFCGPIQWWSVERQWFHVSTVPRLSGGPRPSFYGW
jgi:hypothetical protein